MDGLTGFPQAIEAVYPHAGIQQCIIHQTRNSTKYVSYKDLNKLMANLKKVYAAPGEQAALSNLEDFGENGMRNTRKYRSSGKNTGQILRHISSIRRQSAIGEEKALDGEYHTHGQKACIGAEKCRQQHAAAHMPGRPRPRNWHQRTIPAV